MTSRSHNFVLTLLFLAASLSAQDDTAARIRRVELGLLPPVRIKGEKGWSIEERMKVHNIPGVSIAVYYDDRVVWAKGYGVMDAETKQPVTEQTLFVAGSISKPVAVAGALRLVQEGLLSLDRNINEYLRTWKLPENELTAKRAVTLRLLTTHNAGVTVHGFRGYAAGEPVPTIVQILNGEPPANSAPIRVDIEPGSRWRYAGGGTTIMQLAMEDVSGKPFVDVMKEKVLDPTGMTSSSYEQTLTGERLARAASGHNAAGAVIPGKRHTYPEMAAAGLWTTPTDLARFAIEISQAARGQTNRVLNKELASLMVTKHITVGGTDDMAVGFFMQNYGEEVYVGHGGQDEGFIANLLGHRERGYGIAVMTNSDGRANALIAEITRSVAAEYGWKGYLRDPVTRVDVAKDVLASYEGNYLVDHDVVLTVSLTPTGLIGTPIDDAAFEMVPNSDTSFVRRDQPITFAFARGGKGPAKELVLNIRGRTVRAKRMEKGVLVPREYLNSGDLERAKAEYRALFAKDPQAQAVNEDRLNNLGYQYLQNKKVEAAIAVFSLNVEFYPGSSNVYDSLGEAFMTAGKNELAIKNYSRSLELDPKNENAKRMIEKMRAGN